MTIVVVEWDDAHADMSGGWTTHADIDRRAYRVRSVGFLLTDGKPDHVSIFQSAGGACGDEADAMDSVLHVPVGMVVSIQSVG